MANTSGERDIDRAQELRKRVKDVRSQEAKKTLERTAERLEKRGVRKLGKVGTKRASRPRSRSGGGGRDYIR